MITSIENGRKILHRNDNQKSSRDHKWLFVILEGWKNQLIPNESERTNVCCVNAPYKFVVPHLKSK